LLSRLLDETEKIYLAKAQEGDANFNLSMFFSGRAKIVNLSCAVRSFYDLAARWNAQYNNPMPVKPEVYQQLALLV